MNLKALIATAVLLGTSTAALAAPRQTTLSMHDHRAPTVAARANGSFNERQTIRDHRSQDEGYETPAPRPSTNIEVGWETVGNFNYAFDGLKTIQFGCDGQYVNTVRIFSADQNSEVARVVIHKMDGTSYDYSWNHIFGSANDGQQGPFLSMVPLTQVKSIDVYARNASNSHFAVQVKT